MNTNPTSKLTARQTEFLAGYLPDILFAENAYLRDAELDVFVEKVSDMDFDGRLERQSDVSVAKNLDKKAFFSAFDLHWDIAGQPCVYVQFSRIGAEAVFEVKRRAHQGAGRDVASTNLA